MKNFQKYLSLIAVSLLFSPLGLTGCEDPGTDGQKDDWMAVYPLDLTVNAVGATREIKIMSTELGADIDIEQVQFSVAPNGEDWVELDRVDNVINATIYTNYYEYPRSTVVNITYKNLKRSVAVNQAASAGVIDELIPITGATGTSEEETQEGGRRYTHSYDGDQGTWFNSRFGAITTWPFFLEYTLKTPNTLNYIMYYPRSDSGNKWGSFNKFDVYVTTTANPEKVKIAELERGDGNHTPCKITLDEPLADVKTVYFEIHSAFNSRISCAEMEFHTVTGNSFDYTTVFTDETCSALKEGVTAADIKKLPGEAYKQLANALLAGTYNTDYRVAEFRPYQNPAIMAASNRIYHAYSLRDNPTGIYVNANEELNVLVGDTKGQSVSLVVQNLDLGYGSSRTFFLEKGENIIKTPISGLLYVMNLTDEAIPLILETAEEKAAAATKTVKIHFLNAKVHGYYRKGVTTVDEWTNMLATARYRDIDIVGDYAHLTWPIEYFTTDPAYTPTTIDNLDRVAWLEQEISGLVKYEKMFRNRMYFHVINSGNPNASMNKTAYTPGYSNVFNTASGFNSRVWVLGHEVGHINQVHGFKWAGMTEVSNNVLAHYCQQKLSTATPRLLAPYTSSEATWDGTVYPDIYQAAIAAIVNTGNPHCLDNGGSQFYIKLVPFWQLQLYLAGALGKTDFYPDILEYYRTCEPDASTLSNGAQQLLFVEKACEIANLDLTGFFEKWGFLTPVDKVLNDYGDKPLQITQAMIDATKGRIAAAAYPAARHTADQIIAIRDTNVDDYKQ